MTPAQRTTLSFLDLALIMTGVMAMIASVGDRHPAVAEAFSESFGQDKAARAQQVRLKLASLFEPQEARLTASGRQALAALGGKNRQAEFAIAVPVVAATGASRLDRWELAAARTAAIMRVLADQGVADGAMLPDLARPGGGPAAADDKVRITIRAAGAAKQ
ncbi:MAG: hypothetical protein Q27BB25_14015 [Blastomonas sp. CACIA14H2]|uniref:OmpA family protein n=1 Tax=unclassified Blastomonas TaxID=2626550 RepID=UPI0003CFC2CA|nr:MAG: hypothetical protein Q27BB25_14015 [Blastomonas sp. CACIA14H2]